MWIWSLGQEMPWRRAQQPSILVWRIPWTEETGCLQSLGSQRVRHHWRHLACMQAIPYSRESSRPRDETCVSCVSCTGRQILYQCTTWEANYILTTYNLIQLLQYSPYGHDFTGRVFWSLMKAMENKIIFVCFWSKWIKSFTIITYYF